MQDVKKCLFLILMAQVADSSWKCVWPFLYADYIV